MSLRSFEIQPRFCFLLWWWCGNEMVVHWKGPVWKCTNKRKEKKEKKKRIWFNNVACFDKELDSWMIFIGFVDDWDKGKQKTQSTPVNHSNVIGCKLIGAGHWLFVGWKENAKQQKRAVLEREKKHEQKIIDQRHKNEDKKTKRVMGTKKQDHQQKKTNFTIKGINEKTKQW